MTSRNMLLGALTPDAFDRVAPDLKPVTLSARQVLYDVIKEHYEQVGKQLP
jgi:hypothetical protein